MSIAEPFYTTFLQRTGATFKGYNGRSLRDDALAGLTVAIVAIPQSMAYAIIAEVPPVYGLYTLIFQSLVGALFNSHPLLSLGPVNSQSLVVASIVTRLQSPGDGAAFLTLVVTLTLVKGVLQLAMAGLQLGQLSRYVSRSVIVGFMAGAGVLIAAKQVGPFLGFATPRVEGDWPGVVGICQQLWRGAPGSAAGGGVNSLAIILGVVSLVIVAGGRMITRKSPGPLIAVVLCGAIVALAGWTPDQVNLLGALPVWPDAWPRLTLDPTTLERLIPAGLALGLLGAVETHAIAKSLADRTGHQVNANQDLFGQGLANTVTAFFGCIPGSTSLSRSALNEAAGGKTLLSNLFNAGFVTLTLVLFAGAARHVPMAAIAGILFVVAWGLVDWGYMRRVVRTSGGDSAVLVATFVATLTVPLEYAVLVGVALNIALYMRRATQLHMQEMVPTSAGPFLEQPLTAKSGERAVTFLQIEGSLFFAQADEFEERLSSLLRGPVRVVIFRLKRVHSIDATILTVLDGFARSMSHEDRHIVLCGIRPDLMKDLKEFGLVRLLGNENIFETDFGVFASAEAALERAKQLLGESIDVDAIDTESE